MTGRELYVMALDVSGLRTDSGDIPTSATDLEARCVSLINMLVAENSYLSGLLEGRQSSPDMITELDDTVMLDRRLLTFAIPFGLSSLLIAPENAEHASMLQKKYLDAIDKIKSEIRASKHSITEVY